MTLRGTFNARREAVVRLTIRGPAGVTAEVEAVLDTGFTGALTLPAATVAALALPLGTGVRATLADGSARRYNTYEAEVDWGGTWRNVIVCDLGGDTLAGMDLILGYELRIEAVPGGQVEIGPLPWADDA